MARAGDDSRGAPRSLVGQAAVGQDRDPALESGTIEMNREGTLAREEADLSPRSFAQRYTGRFSDDGSVITGTCEICHDGATRERDFDLNYTRVG